MILRCWRGSSRLQVGSTVLVDGIDLGEEFSSDHQICFVLFVCPSAVVCVTATSRVSNTEFDQITDVLVMGNSLSDDVKALFRDGGWFVCSGDRDPSALLPEGLAYDKSQQKESRRSEFVMNCDSLARFPHLVRPVIFGFVGSFHGMQLIARRARGCCGTRFRRRGVQQDLEGGAFGANFVELEQISQTSHYVQIRGSVPMLWSQVGRTLMFCFRFFFVLDFSSGFFGFEFYSSHCSWPRFFQRGCWKAF